MGKTRRWNSRAGQRAILLAPLSGWLPLAPFCVVNTALERVDGPLSEAAVLDTAVVHHYTTRSADDFRRKTVRGSGMGNHKSGEFWDQIEHAATETCTGAVALGRAVMGGRQTPGLDGPL